MPIGPSGGSSTGAEWSVVIAASDTAAALKSGASVVCTGTADQTPINTVIAALPGTKARVLMLPGTYKLTGAIDFSPLAVASAVEDGSWIDWDASGATIQAAGNLTSLLNLAGAAGTQIFSKLNARFGRLDGVKATYTVTQGIYAQRFVDNQLYVGELVNCSGFGMVADQAGVTDYGCFNNFLYLLKMNSNTGGGFKATSDAASGHIFGFQGNSLKIGQAFGNLNGVEMGSAANGNAILNRIEIGAAEHSVNAGVVDRCGGNIWLVNNTNSNGTVGAIGASGTTTRSTFTFGLVSDSLDTTITTQHYVLSGGHVVGLT